MKFHNTHDESATISLLIEILFPEVSAEQKTVFVEVHGESELSRRLRDILLHRLGRTVETTRNQFGLMVYCGKNLAFFPFLSLEYYDTKWVTDWVVYKLKEDC